MTDHISRICHLEEQLEAAQKEIAKAKSMIALLQETINCGLSEEGIERALDAMHGKRWQRLTTTEICAQRYHTLCAAMLVAFKLPLPVEFPKCKYDA